MINSEYLSWQANFVIVVALNKKFLEQRCIQNVTLQKTTKKSQITKRSNHRSIKKVFLKILLNSQKNICFKISFWIKLLVFRAYIFIQKATPSQNFYCEFCEILKNSFFTQHLQATRGMSVTFLKHISPTHSTFNYWRGTCWKSLLLWTLYNTFGIFKCLKIRIMWITACVFNT